jgi:predicted metal-dependent phosphotriesterase family hydrolase
MAEVTLPHDHLQSMTDWYQGEMMKTDVFTTQHLNSVIQQLKQAYEEAI